MLDARLFQLACASEQFLEPLAVLTTAQTTCNGMLRRTRSNNGKREPLHCVDSVVPSSSLTSVAGVVPSLRRRRTLSVEALLRRRRLLVPSAAAAVALLHHRRRTLVVRTAVRAGRRTRRAPVPAVPTAIARVVAAWRTLLVRVMAVVSAAAVVVASLARVALLLVEGGGRVRVAG